MEVIDLIRDEFKENRKQTREDIEGLKEKVNTLERKMYLIMSLGSVTVTLIVSYIRGFLKWNGSL